MTTCSCGGTLRPTVLDSFDLTGLTALGEVRAQAVEGFACDRCGEKTLTGKAMAQVHLALVLQLLRSPRALTGAEVHFLREWIGATQAEMAKRLGIHRVTLADWERGRKAVSRTGSFMLRSVVVGQVLGNAVLSLREGRQLAREALRSAPLVAARDAHEPYVVVVGGHLAHAAG